MATPCTNFTLGLDLAQSSFHAAVAWSPDQVAQWRKLPNAAFAHPPHSSEGILALTDWLGQVCPGASCQAVVVESTGPLSVRFAAQVSATTSWPGVAIVNPARIRDFGRSLGLREKTDQWDACVIALFGVIHAPEPAPARSKAELELRDLCRLRQTLVERHTAVVNEAAAATYASVIGVLEAEKEAVGQRIRQVEETIDRVVQSDALCRTQVEALSKIKGIGKVTATILTAELGDLRAWGRNSLVAAAGVFPRRRESGTSVWSPPRMVRGGGHRLRRVLYMCATSILGSKGPLRDYATRLADRGLRPMCILGALMRKLLLIARAVMNDGGVYDPSKICRATGR